MLNKFNRFLSPAFMNCVTVKRDIYSALLEHLFFTMIRNPSCNAAKVAIMHITMLLNFISKTPSVIGNRNRSNPESLFAIVCKDKSFFWNAKPKIKFNNLIAAIIIAHAKINLGKSTTGSSFIMQTAVKAISASVSSFEPNSLVVSVLLAIKPSSMSLTPADIYKK